MNRIISAVVMAVLGFAPLPAGVISSGPPVAERLSVEAGRVGQTILVEGRNLGGADLVVLFGAAAAAAGAENPGRSRQTIQVEVPGRIDPRDPGTVTVTVFVNGQEAEYPDGPLQFTYVIPQPYPAIEDYDTGDPQSPRSVAVAQPFEIHLTGTHFTTGRRAPVSCLAIGPATEKATGLAGEATDSGVVFRFAGLPYSGSYRFLVGFSDGATAAIDAPQFAYQVFGYPPVIQQVEFAGGTESIACDETRVVELGACAFTGLPDLKALSPGVILEGTYTGLRMSALITDPDSSPGHTDILLATASFSRPSPSGPPIEFNLSMLDDGSSASFEYGQQSGWLQDCSDATPDACACRGAVYSSSSGDTTAGDDRFTRNVALVNPTTNPLVQDCVVEQTQRTLLLLAPGDAIAFRFEALDREGNLTSWPTQPAVSAGTDTVMCTGDPCGCCLLLSTDPTAPPPTGCSGLEGMLSSSLPDGLCRSF